MAGVKSNIITAVVIKGRDAANAPQLPELVSLTAQHCTVREVSADKAYSVLYNLQAIERAGAKAYIPHKSNHTENRGGIWRNPLITTVIIVMHSMLITTNGVMWRRALP
jgi:hypothetical protein